MSHKNNNHYSQAIITTLMLSIILSYTISYADSLVVHDQRGRKPAVPKNTVVTTTSGISGRNDGQAIKHAYDPSLIPAKFKVAKRKSIQNISSEPIKVTIHYINNLKQETFMLEPHEHRRLNSFNFVRKIDVNGHSFGSCFTGDPMMRMTEDNLDVYATIAYYGEIDGPGHLSCHILPVLIE